VSARVLKGKKKHLGASLGGDQNVTINSVSGDFTVRSHFTKVHKQQSLAA